MFAVPGWSVSAESLRAEAEGGKGKKRKRPGSAVSAAAATDVTAANVAHLYETLVQGRAGQSLKPGHGPKTGSTAKRRKRDRQAQQAAAPSRHHDQPPPTTAKSRNKEEVSPEAGREAAREGVEALMAAPDKGTKKSKKRKALQAADSRGAAAMVSSAPKAASDAAVDATTSKLTPLQASMREKLVSARFRHLNETLYTRPSAEAFRLFDESPEMFGQYHEGFRRQVNVWPENPVDSFLRDIRARAAAGAFPAKKGRSGKVKNSCTSGRPLPRTAGTCTIADLGCGDARLAESLQADKERLRLEVKSFDLQSPNQLVTKADMADLPLPDGSVNVAIFCLALMGTNWIDFVEEAYRILHWKGELWVAEIKSRFAPAGDRRGPVQHSVGARKKKTPAGKKTGPGAEAADAAGGLGAEDELAVEVDGAPDRRRETDVSAFVEALQRRGFLLDGQEGEAIDLSNRMFVKMHFIKAAAPTKGKGLSASSKKPQSQTAPPLRWETGGTADEADAKEATILKPCVYKIR